MSAADKNTLSPFNCLESVLRAMEKSRETLKLPEKISFDFNSGDTRDIELTHKFEMIYVGRDGQEEIDIELAFGPGKTQRAKITRQEHGFMLKGWSKNDFPVLRSVIEQAVTAMQYYESAFDAGRNIKHIFASE